MRHGDLVGIEGVGEGALQLLLWDEMKPDPVVEGLKAGTHLVRNGLVDETVHDFPHPLDGLDGYENGGVNEERAWSLGIGGDEPIEVDPHEVPDHDIDAVGQGSRLKKKVKSHFCDQLRKISRKFSKFSRKK